MKAIVCLDDRNGMCFNHRRQSKDRKLIADIVSRANGEAIWMNDYSAPLFCDGVATHVSEQFLTEAPPAAWCFVENQPLAPVKEHIDTLIVYRWNRHYPSDLYLDLNLEEGSLVASEDFEGYSHEKITREEYHQ